MGLKTRSKIMMHYFKNREVRKKVPFADFARAMLSPSCEKLAQRYIQRCDADDEYVYYKISGVPGRLFQFPKVLGEGFFYQAVSEMLYEKNWHYYQVPETKVDSKDVVVDCGAAEGLFTFSVMQKARHIYAVEPLPYFVRSLNTMFANDSNVTVLNTALSDKSGVMFLEDKGFL